MSTLHVLLPSNPHEHCSTHPCRECAAHEGERLARAVAMDQTLRREARLTASHQRTFAAGIVHPEFSHVQRTEIAGADMVVAYRYDELGIGGHGFLAALRYGEWLQWIGAQPPPPGSHTGAGKWAW